MIYVPGDFWRDCQVCGFRYRASQTRRRWDNLIVCDADWEERHQQDNVRGRKDRQRVPDPRPEPVEVFLGGGPFFFVSNSSIDITSAQWRVYLGTGEVTASDL